MVPVIPLTIPMLISFRMILYGDHLDRDAVDPGGQFGRWWFRWWWLVEWWVGYTYNRWCREMTKIDSIFSNLSYCWSALGLVLNKTISWDDSPSLWFLLVHSASYSGTQVRPCCSVWTSNAVEFGVVDVVDLFHLVYLSQLDWSDWSNWAALDSSPGTPNAETRSFDSFFFGYQSVRFPRPGDSTMHGWIAWEVFTTDERGD